MWPEASKQLPTDSSFVVIYCSQCQLPSQTMVEVQPLVHVSTCPVPLAQEPRVSANISHAFLAAAQKVHLEEEG